MADGDAPGYDFSIRVASIDGEELTVSGLPHASSQDDVYRGLFIPKGLPISNVYSALCDSQLTILFNRISNDSQRLVSQHHPPDIYLKMLQGGSA